AGGVGNAADTAAAKGQRFGAGPEAALSLVKERMQPLVFLLQLRRSNHAAVTWKRLLSDQVDRALILSRRDRTPRADDQMTLGSGDGGLRIAESAGDSRPSPLVRRGQRPGRFDRGLDRSNPDGIRVARLGSSRRAPRVAQHG